MIVWLRTVSFFFRKGNCLAFQQHHLLVSLGTWVLLDCCVLYLWPLPSISDDVSGCVGQLSIVLIGTWKICLVFADWHFDQHSHCLSLCVLLDFPGDFVEFAWRRSDYLVRPFRNSDWILHPSHIGSDVILSNIRILGFLSVWSWPPSNTKSPLRPSLQPHYLLKLFLSIDLGL